MSAGVIKDRGIFDCEHPLIEAEILRHGKHANQSGGQQQKQQQQQQQQAQAQAQAQAQKQQQEQDRREQRHREQQQQQAAYYNNDMPQQGLSAGMGRLLR